MNTFEQQNERARRSAAEGRELNAEAKEKQAEEAEKKMAAKERIEVTSKEIKSTQNQMQNIIANMQAVVKAVAAIRLQLGVVSNDDSIPSVKQDEKAVEALKKKLDALYGEIGDLKVALLAEEQKQIQEERPELGIAAIEAEAQARIQILLRQLGVE